VSKLSCAKFDKLINLFLDGRLLPEEESELKEHLTECKRCQEKLSLLELVEVQAKRIPAEEPSQEYWDTFSSRVRGKIVARQEKSLAVRWKQAFGNILIFSPLKIKIAAGLVSILLVFIVGKLYVDYRGREIVPTSPITPTVKEQQLPPAEAKEKATLPPEEGKKEIGSTLGKPKTAKQPAITEERERKGMVKEKAAAEKKALPKEEQKLIPVQIEKEKGIPPSPSTLESRAPVEAEKPNELPSTSLETKPTGAGVEKKVEKKEEMIVSVQAEQAQKTEEAQQKGEAQRTVFKDVNFSAKPSYIATSVADHYVVNEKTIPKIKETDTLMQADELRGIIQTWKTHVQENPTDSLSQQGYLQVAIGYYLLIRLTRDTTTISEGTKFLEEHLDQIKDPAIKDQLSERLKKIRTLK
jgi:hypothetical protein